MHSFDDYLKRMFKLNLKFKLISDKKQTKRRYLVNYLMFPIVMNILHTDHYKKFIRQKNDSFM